MLRLFNIITRLQDIVSNIDRWCIIEHKNIELAEEFNVIFTNKVTFLSSLQSKIPVGCVSLKSQSSKELKQEVVRNSHLRKLGTRKGHGI